MTATMPKHCQKYFQHFLNFPNFLFLLLISLLSIWFSAAQAEFSLFGKSDSLQSSDPLPPDEAFAFSSAAPQAEMLPLRWQIAPEHYLYRDKFKFALLDANNLEIGAPTLPVGKEKEDPYFGKLEIFHGLVEFELPLQHIDKNAAASGTLKITYQGCAERGICYPPMHKKIPIQLAAASNGVESTSSTTNHSENQITETTEVAQTTETKPLLSEQDQIAASLQNGNLFWILLSFFGFGLLLALTPCVFPMIPILSGIIVGQGQNLSTGRAFSMSLVYVIAMALTYTGAGILAGLFGQNLQAAFQNPWIIGTFSAIFVILAMSMFGFYELQLPSRFQSKITEVSNRQKGGTLAGVAIMGVLSALIVGPCVAAPLAGALIYIGQTGDALLGGLALFALGMGMGAPLLLLGTSAGKLLPHAGAWMETIKAVFGVMLIGVAIWMLERILPTYLTMLLWAILLIVSAIYMGALAHPTSNWGKLWKGIGVILLLYGMLIIIGASAGNRDLFQPLKGVLNIGSLGTPNGIQAAEIHLQFEQIKGLDGDNQDGKTVRGLNAILAEAKAKNQSVFLDFYADWCISCIELEKFTFSDPDVQRALSGVKLVQADVTANDDFDQALMKQLNIIGPPALLFFDSNGEEVQHKRLVQFIEAEPFLSHISDAFGKKQ